MNELTPHRRPETFDDGVIVARSGSSDRLENAVSFAQRSKVIGHVLCEFNRWKQHLLVEVIVGARRKPPQVSSIRGSFEVVC